MSFDEQLSKLLAQPVTKEPKPSRDRDWGFTQEHAPHDENTRTITATVGTKLETEDDWTRFVVDNGGALAPGYRVRLVEMRHNTHAWQRTEQGEDATTIGSWFYKFAVEPITVGTAMMEDILAIINKRKPVKPERATGDVVFHYLAGDLQLGKVDGDGSEGIVETVMSSLDKALAAFKQVRKVKPVGIVHLAFLGDCIEGNQSQNGRNMWRTTLTVTEQVRVFRRIMLHAVNLFAPLVDVLEIDVVNGNHDQVQRFQETRADDGHATEAAISLMDSLALNPDAYGHVKVFVPNRDESYITRQIGSSVVTMAHGHQWSRGKAMAWWSSQAMNWQSPGAAQFLFHGHEHTMGMETKRDRVVVCVPTFESESTWWRHKTGDMAKRGAIIMTSVNGQFADLEIVD